MRIFMWGARILSDPIAAIKAFDKASIAWTHVLAEGSARSRRVDRRELAAHTAEQSAMRGLPTKPAPPL